MKLTLLFTKIAASFVVFAKAVNGQDNCTGVAGFPLEFLNQTYCSLPTAQRGIFEAVVFTSLEIDSSGAFLATCLGDFLTAVVAAQNFEWVGCNPPRADCEGDKSEYILFSPMYNATITTTIGWDTPMCLAATCNIDTLEQVLNATFVDLMAVNSPGILKYNYSAIATYAATPECIYDQIVAPVENPELYCGDVGPVCINKTLVEITLGDDAPFEVAICNDNDCLASLGTADVAGHYATGYIKANPYCFRSIEEPRPPFATVNLDVSSKHSDKAFNMTNYCTVEAASGRTGRCGKKDVRTSCVKAKKAKKAKKSAKAPQVPKSSEQGKKSKRNV